MAAARWWKAFIFAEGPCDEVRRLSDADPIAVAGEIDADVYSPNGGEPRVNWRLTVDAVISARCKPKADDGSGGDSSIERGREIAPKSGASPYASAGGVPFNDAAPFTRNGVER